MTFFDSVIPDASAAITSVHEQGKKFVGVYCVFAPQELIVAADAVPVTLCSTREEPIADGEKYLPRNFCPLIKSSYGFAITGKCAFFNNSEFIIGETTCDGKKKMFELMEASSQPLSSNSRRVQRGKPRSSTGAPKFPGAKRRSRNVSASPLPMRR